MGIRSKNAIIQEAVSGRGRAAVAAPVTEAVQISLVIPVYNAAPIIETNLKQAATYLDLLGGFNELILVDDASTDGTREIVQSLAKKLPGGAFVPLFNERNRGKGYSVRRGFSAARGKHLIFNDADFTYPIGEVEKVSHHLNQGADIVIGCRIHPDSRYEIGPDFFSYFYTRHLMSRIFNRIVNLVLNLRIRDTQAGIKGFTREAAVMIFQRQDLNRFSFDLELLFIARKLGLKINEVPIRFLYHKEPTTVKFFQDSIRILFDLARIRWRNCIGRYRL